MTSAELQAALHRLGYTQAAFARMLGIHRLTVHHWLRATHPIPHYVGVVVELLEERAKR
jgi:hypothetical protein